MKVFSKKIKDLLIPYIKSGKLPLMIAMAPFFLNKNRTNLEIFRERLDYSIHKSLAHTYYNMKVTNDYNSVVRKNFKKEPIWFMWLQGIEKAPALCRANYHYLQRVFSDSVILITADNLFSYIDLPDFIIDKWEKGTISNTHFSDIIRIQLLCTYGGTWIDSTVVVKKEFMHQLPEFQIPQTFKPGRNGNSIPVSNWFIHAPQKNRFIMRVRDLLFTYWSKKNYAMDYFIFHHFMVIVSQEMDGYLDRIPPLDNTLPHYLMLKMRQQPLSKAEMTKYLQHFELMKFTNKIENGVEENNYKLLVELLQY